MSSYMADKQRWSPERKERGHKDKDRERGGKDREKDREGAKHSHKSRDKHSHKHRDKERDRGEKGGYPDRDRQRDLRNEPRFDDDNRERSRDSLPGPPGRYPQDREVRFQPSPMRYQSPGKAELGGPSKGPSGEFHASTSSSSLVADLRSAALEQLRKRKESGSTALDDSPAKRRRFSPQGDGENERDRLAGSRWSSENGRHKEDEEEAPGRPPRPPRRSDNGSVPADRSDSDYSGSPGPSSQGKPKASASREPENSDEEEGEIMGEEAIAPPRPSRWKTLGELGTGRGSDGDVTDEDERDALLSQYEALDQLPSEKATMFGKKGFGKMPSSRWTDQNDDEDEERQALSKHEQLATALAAATGDLDRELNKKELEEVEEDGVEEGVVADEQDAEAEEVNAATPSTQQRLRRVDMLQACRSVEEFERLNCIDEGAYGVVYRARDKKSGEIFALKKVKMEKEKDGFPMTAIREMNILLSFHHPNIVNVSEVVMGNNMDSVFMAMEFMEHDLKGLLDMMKHPFSVSEVKTLMLQLLEGVSYLHDNWVLHRDLKTSNILYSNDGTLKICDFGLARQYGSPLKPYTNMVVTLWYRAPELLLGEKTYSTAIDIWSLGCIMGELLTKEPLLNGQSELEQLHKMFKLLGTPVDPPIGVHNDWEGYSQLHNVKKFRFQPQPTALREKFPVKSFTGGITLSDLGFDLLSNLLKYDPAKRLSAAQALEHSWFSEHPTPKAKELMPTHPTRKDGLARKMRKLKSPDPLEEQRRREQLQARMNKGDGGLFSFN